MEFYICFGPTLYETLTKMRVISDKPILHTCLGLDCVARCERLLTSFKKAKEKERKSLLVDLQAFLISINHLDQEERSQDVVAIMEAIGEQLSGNFDQKIDMVHLANSYHMSYEHMRKCFKEKTGIAPHHYRIIKRINEGKRLLHDPNLSIKMISEQIGYTDQYAFSNQFKKIVGLSPRAFRKIL